MIDKKKSLITAIIATVIAVGFSIVVMTVDVRPIGYVQTEVGLSHLNEKVFNALMTNMTWYNITMYLGYVALAIVGAWAIVGLMQWIKRKNILKVDRTILCLGGLFVITLLLYAAFTKIMINGRPIIMPGEGRLEPSFPSSHTVMVCVVVFSSRMILNDYVSNKKIRTVMKALLAVMLVVMIVGRMLSGVHWITDIIAGVLISGMLISWFRFSISGEEPEWNVGYSQDDRCYHPKH